MPTFAATLPLLSLPALCRWALLCLVLGWAATVQADDYQAVNRLLKAGQTTQALAKVEQHLRNQPRDPQMRFFKAVIFSQTARTAEAVSELTSLTQDYPELPEPYNNLAVIYASQGQLDKARQALEQALRANPGYAAAHENLGDVYARLAGESYARALQLDATLLSVAPKLALIRQLLPTAAKAAP